MFNKPVYIEIHEKTIKLFSCILGLWLSCLFVCFVYEIFLSCYLSVHILFNIFVCQLTKCYCMVVLDVYFKLHFTLHA